MARFRPVGLTAKEQDSLREERISREAEATSKRATAARVDHGNRFDRLRKRAADLGITRADALPQLAPLLAVQRSLKAGVERVLAELDLLDIERYLARSTDNKSSRENLRARRDMRKAQLKISEPPAPPSGELPAAVQKALEVLGKNAPTIKEPASRAGRMAELQQMQIDFEDGLRELHPLIQEIKSSAGYDEAVKLQARHQKLHLALFRAEQAYSELASEERELREAFTHSGYSRSDLLPAPSTLNVTLMLGSETDWNSAISQHRRSLENRGILK